LSTALTTWFVVYQALESTRVESNEWGPQSDLGFAGTELDVRCQAKVVVTVIG
jgi:hypothetical protein